MWPTTIPSLWNPPLLNFSWLCSQCFELLQLNEQYGTSWTCAIVLHVKLHCTCLKCTFHVGVFRWTPHSTSSFCSPQRNNSHRCHFCPYGKCHQTCRPKTIATVWLHAQIRSQLNNDLWCLWQWESRSKITVVMLCLNFASYFQVRMLKEQSSTDQEQLQTIYNERVGSLSHFHMHIQIPGLISKGPRLKRRMTNKKTGRSDNFKLNKRKIGLCGSKE